MYIELTGMGFSVERQKKVLVYYKQQIVGDYFADLTVEDVVICELKTHEKLSEENENQLINYLKGTSIEIGLLLNFGKKPEIRRKIYDNEKKAWYTTRMTPL